MSEDGGMIFGTNISSHRVIAELERFIMQFDVPSTEVENLNEKYYYQKLLDFNLEIGSDVFEVKGTHLK